MNFQPIFYLGLLARTEFLEELVHVQALGGDTASARQTLRLAKAHPREPFTIARADFAPPEPHSAFAWSTESVYRATVHRRVLPHSAQVT